jgi:hypothetical protein
MDALAQVRRLGLAHAGRLVDAAELLVQLRVIEVGQLDRADQRAQQQPADRIPGAPALEHREPLRDRRAGERAPRAEPRHRVEPAEQPADPALHRARQQAEEPLDLGHGRVPGGRQEASGRQRGLGDRDQGSPLR